MTTAEKILDTLRELSSPDDDAGGLELAFGSVAMMLERALPDALAETKEGELDDIMLALTRWFATLRGDGIPQMVVVELPRRETGKGIILARVDEAIAAADTIKGFPL